MGGTSDLLKLLVRGLTDGQLLAVVHLLCISYASVGAHSVANLWKERDELPGVLPRYARTWSCDRLPTKSARQTSGGCSLERSRSCLRSSGPRVRNAADVKLVGGEITDMRVGITAAVRLRERPDV